MKVDIADAVAIVAHLYSTGAWRFRIPPPYPEPGPLDPSRPGWSIDCDSYGGIPPLEDPAARIRVLDTVARGGDCDSAKVTLSISSSRTLGGFSGTLLAGEGILSDGDLLRSSRENEFA